MAVEATGIRIRRDRLLAGIGFAAWGVSWVLPTWQAYGFDEKPYPGWACCWLALGSLIDAIRGYDHRLSNIVNGVTALTNVPMLVALLRISQRAARGSLLGWLLVGAGLLNAAWLLEKEYAHRLGPGYYLWWLSFFVVGLAILDRHRTSMASP